MTGPALGALVESFPGMADDPLAIGSMAALDCAGATQADVDAAFSALDRARYVRAEFTYWRAVLTVRVTGRLPEVRTLLDDTLTAGGERQ